MPQDSDCFSVNEVVVLNEKLLGNKVVLQDE